MATAARPEHTSPCSKRGGASDARGEEPAQEGHPQGQAASRAAQGVQSGRDAGGTDERRQRMERPGRPRREEGARARGPGEARRGENGGRRLRGAGRSVCQGLRAGPESHVQGPAHAGADQVPRQADRRDADRGRGGGGGGELLVVRPAPGGARPRGREGDPGRGVRLQRRPSRGRRAQAPRRRRVGEGGRRVRQGPGDGPPPRGRAARQGHRAQAEGRQGGRSRVVPEGGRRRPTQRRGPRSAPPSRQPLAVFRQARAGGRTTGHQGGFATVFPMAGSAQTGYNSGSFPEENEWLKQPVPSSSPSPSKTRCAKRISTTRCPSSSGAPCPTCATGSSPSIAGSSTRCSTRGCCTTSATARPPEPWAKC